MPTVSKALLVCLCLAVAGPAQAAPLFESDEVIDLELIGPLHTVISNKETREESPFVLRSDGVDLDIDVRVRGRSRLDVCELPPLRFNFERSDAGAGPFAGIGRLKLVTHCRRGERGEKDAVEEYLAYRFFGRLPDVSYRVRLLRITYSDTDGRVETDREERYGFFIEPLDHLAERVGGVRTEIGGVALGWLDPHQAALVYVFQYMIGNTDWSFVATMGEDECCHNGDLIKRDDLLYYVPYDFDLAGIVNAPYAKPLPEMRLRDVRQRRYRGFCTDTEILRGAIRRVNARRDDILELIHGTPGLSRKGTERAVEYLDGYFEKAADEDDLLRAFERACKDV